MLIFVFDIEFLNVTFFRKFDILVDNGMPYILNKHS